MKKIMSVILAISLVAFGGFEAKAEKLSGYQLSELTKNEIKQSKKRLVVVQSVDKPSESSADESIEVSIKEQTEKIQKAVEEEGYALVNLDVSQVSKNASKYTLTLIFEIEK